MSIGATSSDLTEISINFSGTGDNTVVSAVAGQHVRVYKIFFVVNAATNLIFKNDGTGLTGSVAMLANGSFVLDFDERPWFTATSGNAFIINQSGTAQISGRCYYVQA